MTKDEPPRLGLPDGSASNEPARRSSAPLGPRYASELSQSPNRQRRRSGSLIRPSPEETRPVALQRSRFTNGRPSSVLENETLNSDELYTSGSYSSGNTSLALERKISKEKYSASVRSGSRSPRRQSSAEKWASNIRLSEFRKKKLVFYWPPKDAVLRSNTLQLKPDATLPSPPYYRSSLGKTAAFVMAFEVTQDHGFADRIAVKEISWGCEKERLKVEQEISNLKVLSHNHIIMYLGAWYQHKTIGILMFPVAAYNLQKFMEMASKDNENQSEKPFKEHAHVPLLRRYFACLCQGLLYLHEKKRIKHKDIKPENILVDQYDSVILADFGISTQQGESANPVTIGPTGYTMRYAAPEAVNEGERDYDIDIFSMGCVFLEMATVIVGETIPNLCTFVGRPANNNEQQRLPGDDTKLEVKYCVSASKIAAWIDRLRDKADETGRHLFSTSPGSKVNSITDNDIFTIMLQMMSVEPKKRPKLRQIWTLFDTVTKPCVNCHPTIIENGFDHYPPCSQLLQDSNFPPTPPKAFADKGKSVVNGAEVKDDTLTKDFVYGDSSPQPSNKLGLGRSVDDPAPETLYKPDISISLAPGDPISSFQESYTEERLVPPSPMLHGGSSRLEQMKKGRSETKKEVAFNPQTTSQEDRRQDIANEAISQVPRSDSRPSPQVPDSPSKEQQLVRVISFGRKPAIKSLARGLQDVPCKKIIVYDNITRTVEVVEKEKEVSGLTNGVLMKMPHGDGWKWRTVAGDLNLWKLMDLKLNLIRAAGGIRMMFFRGQYRTSELLSAQVLAS